MKIVKKYVRKIVYDVVSSKFSLLNSKRVRIHIGIVSALGTGDLISIV